MRKISKKSYLLVVMLLIIVTIFSIYNIDNFDSENNNDKPISNIEINVKNAKAINIINTEIINISNSYENDTTTKIENTSDFYVSNVWLKYEELDKNNNIVSNSETFLDLTLLPGELASIAFPHKEYTKSIKVISYGYETDNKSVLINLKKDDIKIKDNQKQIKNSKGYEVLNISDIHKTTNSENANTYIVKVKNSSQRDLGNITLKIGELKDGEYITVNHLSAYSILKASEEIQIDIPASIDANKLNIIGYSYDDIKEKANIDIDLKSHRAKINK